MSEPRVTPEASMEEILASIRRIISEDGSPPAPQAAAPEVLAPQVAEPAAAAPIADAPTPIPPGDSSPAASPPPARPLDPMTPTSVWGMAGNRPTSTGKELVLTQIVAGDGSVVALDRPAMDALAAAAPNGPVEPSRPQPIDVLLLTDALPTNLPDAAVAAAPRTPPAPPLSEETDHVGRASAQTTNQSNMTPSKPDSNPARQGGPTLEELVRQSLEPKIQEWLNANLKDIVERLVQEEIQRIGRRAE